MAVSAFSAVLHNLLQNTAFILVSATPGMAIYYPYLALAGIPAGMIVGAAVTLLLGSERLMRALPFKTENRVRQEEET